MASLFKDADRRVLAPRSRTNKRTRASRWQRRLRIEHLEPRLLLNGDWQNPSNRFDITDDGLVTPLDVLVIVVEVNNRTLIEPNGELPDRSQHADAPFYDTDGNGFLAPIDVLEVIAVICLDADPPAIVTQLAIDTAPGGSTNNDGLTSDPTLTGTVTDMSGVASFQAQVDAGQLRVVDLDRSGGFAFDPGLALDGTADGNHTVRLTAVDARGNTSSPLDASFTLDTTQPDLTLESPVQQGNHLTAVRLAGSVNDAGSGVSSVRCSVDAEPFGEVSADAQGRFDAPVKEDPLATGLHEVRMEVTDSAGNATQRTVNFEVVGDSPLIEVSTSQGFLPLDYSVVASVMPTVQIRGDLPAGARIFNDRTDGRAGIGGGVNGLGKEVSSDRYQIDEVAPQTLQVTLDVLAGVNAILVTDTDATEIIASATMLNYSPDFEDLNGNELLDTGEDANHNGELDPGEDVNGNQALDVDEDFNNNGLLDPGEDLNGNELLDLNEDSNGNAGLDLDEDLNGNGQIDVGEDFNVNGQIDPVSRDVGAVPLADDLAYDAELGYVATTRSLLLRFLEGTAPHQISAYLRAKELKPLGVSFGFPNMSEPRLITVEVPAGTTARELKQRLNGSAAPQLPVDPPLEIAVQDGIIQLADVSVATEQLPDRLANGGYQLNVDEGYEAAALNGGFDDDGDVSGFDFDGDGSADEDQPNGIDDDRDSDDFGDLNGDGLPTAGEPGVDVFGRVVVDGVDNDGDGDVDEGIDEDGQDPSDELEIFWDHFFMDTFAAHRLATHLSGSARYPGIAIIDTGLGDGSQTGTSYGSIPLFGITDCTGESCSLKRLDQIADLRAPGGHGTPGTFFAAGDGHGVLGTGLHVQVRPIRVAGAHSGSDYFLRSLRVYSTVSSDLANALKEVVADPGVQVINFSWGSAAEDANNSGEIDLAELQSFQSHLHDVEHIWKDVIQQLQASGKILTIAAGNDGFNTSFTWLDMFDVPAGPRDENDAGALFLAVGATGRGSNLHDKEQHAEFSNRGALVSVSAPGKDLVCVAPSPISSDDPPAIRSQNCQGTSYAAPKVAGLAAELLYYNGIDGLGKFSPFQVVELIEATADDLGTDRLDAQYPDNHQPGDGEDYYFGAGRINVWKALLSRVNQGLAEERHPGSTFSSLERIAVSDAQWLGFRIVTSVKGATVWVDDQQLTDASNSEPLVQVANAYQGVRSDTPILMGIDVDRNGVLDENPTDGVVPVGTRVPGRGEYVSVFSIRREDLKNPDGSLRVLSLRMPGQDADDPPFYNLRLQVGKMATGRVPGVTYDDFVFELTPPDFGDAFDDGDFRNGGEYSTLLISNGARSLNSNLEWLGPHPDTGSAESDVWLHGVSPEPNAGGELEIPFFPTPIDAAVDVDGTPNLLTSRMSSDDPDVPRTTDLDRFDNSVVFYPLTYATGSDGRADFMVCVADADSSRYTLDPDRSLYVNAWIDWDASGNWGEGDEHIIDGLQIEPRQGWAWGIHQNRKPLNPVSFIGASASGNCARFRAEFSVPAVSPTGELWARFRVDYGEDVGRNDPQPHFQSQSVLNLATGPSRFGEVEDYLIGSDFGTAPDPFQGTPGEYPTLSLHQGAHHLDVTREWLGETVTRELDAFDGDNDGVIVPSAVSPGESVPIQVTVSSTVSSRGYQHTGNGTVTSWNPSILDQSCGDPAMLAFPLPATPAVSTDLGRYNGNDPKKTLYISAWADWNGDGTWGDGEQVMDAIRIAPETFGMDERYTLGEPFTDANKNGVHDDNEAYEDVAGRDSQTYQCKVRVPDEVATDFWWRFRLDYGEQGATDNSVVHYAQHSGRSLVDEKGGALFGEVEDYRSEGVPSVPIKRALPTVVLIGETTHFTIELPNTTQITLPAMIMDNVPIALTVDPLTVACDGFTDCGVTTDPGTGDVTVFADGELAPGVTGVVEFDTTAPRFPPYDPVVPNCAWTTLGLASVKVCTSVTVVSGPGLQLAESPVAAQDDGHLSFDDLAPIVDEALSRWQHAGLTEQHLNRLQNATYSIADLPGSYLGVAAGNVIYLDRTAAGYGWFIDATPERNEEFEFSYSRTFRASESNLACGKVDLSTVVSHELGHLLGLDDLETPETLMAARLDLGVRKIPLASDVDALFATGVGFSALDAD